MMTHSLYAEPVRDVNLQDCYYYHTIELPDHGVVNGDWDLRGLEHEYLGNIDLKGQRVLEIGPASGAMTAYMETQGADVVAVEQHEDAVWDFVPYALSQEQWDDIKKKKRENNRRLKNSFWHTHQALDLHARVYYGSARDLPAELGDFDVATIGLVLTHTRDPITIMESCARLTTGKLVITDRFFEGHEQHNRPALELLPKNSSPVPRVGSWWYFSERFFKEILTIMGFTSITVTYGKYPAKGKPATLATIVAER